LKADIDARERLSTRVSIVKVFLNSIRPTANVFYLCKNADIEEAPGSIFTKKE
jgi:hypothetical protein